MSDQQQPPYPGPYGQQPPGQQPPYPGQPQQPQGYPGHYGQQPQQPTYPGQYQQYQQQHPHQAYSSYGQYPAYPAQGATKPPPDSTAKLIGWILAGLGVVLVIAPFLTWWTGEFAGEEQSFRGLGMEDVGGIEISAGDGVLTLVLALVVLGFAIARGFGALSLTAAVIGTVMGCLITLIAIADSVTDEPLKLEGPNGEDIPLAEGIEWSTGIGLWLTLAAGVLMLLVAVVGIVKRR
jgi:hypothetical protein